MSTYYDVFYNVIKEGDKVDLYSLIGKKYVKPPFFSGTKTIRCFGHIGKTPVAYFDEGGGAHSIQALVKHTGQRIFKCKLWNKSQLDRIYRGREHELGWWHDVCPGKTLYLKRATKEDLSRCILRDGASNNPNDYFVELFERGSLIHKDAIKYIEADISELKD